MYMIALFFPFLQPATAVGKNFRLQKQMQNAKIFKKLTVRVR